MISTIRSKKFSSGLKIINRLGIISIFIICAVNIVSFFIQYDDSLKQRSNFEKIFWIYQLKKYISLVYSDNGLYQGLLTGLYDYIKQEEMANIFSLLQTNNNYLYVNYKSFVEMQIEISQKPVYVFDLANSYQLNMGILNINDYSQVTIQVTSLSYDIFYFQNLIYYIMYLKDPYDYYDQTSSINYQYLFAALEDVYHSNLSNFDSQLNESKVLLILQLILISVMTVTLSLMMIPVQIFIQQKREEILRLFATISPDKLCYMIQVVDNYLNQQERIELDKQRMFSMRSDPRSFTKTKIIQPNHNIKMSHSTRSNPNVTNYQNNGMLRNIENMKKKNISQTNSLPKLTLGIFVGIIVGLISMQFYGVSKYIIGNNIVEDFQTSLSFLASFDYFFDSIASLISIRYAMSEAIHQSNQQYVDSTFYLKTAKKYQSQSKTRLQDLMNQFNNYEDYNGYYKQGIQSFLLPLFKQNTCDTLQNDPKNYKGDLIIDFNKCRTLFGGVLQSGLFVSSQKYISLYDTFAEGAYAFDDQKLQQTLLGMYQTVSVQDEYEFSFQVMFIIKSVHNFFQDQYATNYNYQLGISIFLLALQLIVLLIVMVFGWRRYYKQIAQQFFQTKQLLDLIDLNILLDSPYVISYFKRNS